MAFFQSTPAYYSKEENYFTVTVIPSGIGDQLFQFSRLFKIGQALDFQFIYTPLTLQHRHHSKHPEENIFVEFNLGLDEEVFCPRKTKSLQQRKINLYSLLTRNKLKVPADLKDLLLRKFGTGNLFHLTFISKMYQKDDECWDILEHIPGQHSFPFKDKYWFDKETLPTDKTLICVHIRRGDANLVKIRDNLYFSFFYQTVTSKPEKLNARLGNRWVSTAAYLQTLKGIIPTLKQAYQIIIITDGIDIVAKFEHEYYRRLRKYFSSPDEMTAHFRTNFEEEFRIFKALDHCEILAGAYDYQVTRESIYLLGNADIIITPPNSGFSNTMVSLINQKSPRFMVCK